MPDTPRHSARRRLLGVAASLWTGLSLLAFFFLYLAAASIWCEVGQIGFTSAHSLYTFWPLKVLVAALVANMVVATFQRMPVRLAELGGWGAHLGVVILALGATWYVVAANRGEAVAVRVGRTDRFTTIDRFFIDGADAMYVSPVAGGLDAGRQTPLARALEPWGLSHAPQTIATPFDDLSVVVVESMPSAGIVFDWRDGGPAPAPAVDLTIHDGPHAFDHLVCPSYPFAREAEIGGYVIRLAGEATPATAAAERQDVVVISRQDPLAVLTVTTTEGKTSVRRVPWGHPVELTLAGRKVGLTVHRFFSRAWRAAVARPAEPGEGRPAVKVELRVGGWHGSQWIGYDAHVKPIRLDDPDLQSLPLPGGRWAAFHLAPRSEPLPAPVTIDRWQYQTWPASSIPRDYVCDLRVGDASGAAARTVTCRLNQPARVGSVRLYQGRWSPNPEDPAEIIFLVSSRPGIWAIWTGCLLVCLSMPYAFYVKPWLKGRRRAPL